MSSIKLFESKKIRSEWNEPEQKWYFAIIDVIEIPTSENYLLKTKKTKKTKELKKDTKK